MMSLLLSLHASAAPAEPVHITPTTRSPVILEADLDEDGVMEQVVVGFSLTREVTVAVYEPDGSVARLNLGQFVDFSGIRDELYVSLPDPAVTGVPLLEVLVPAAEQCGSWDRDHYIRYQSGQLAVAISAINGSDSPAYTYEEITFHPETRGATMTAVSGDDAGETTTITRHQLVGGLYEIRSTVTRHQVF